MTNLPCERWWFVRSRKGFQCDVAQNGLEALEMIFAGQYDVVLTDFRTPQLQGGALAT